MAVRARRIPTKGTAQRHWFCIRDTSLTPITAAWTGKSCTVLTDGGGVATPAITQVAGSHWGYVDIPDASMIGDAIQVSISITNANAKPVDVVLYPANIIPAGGIPDDFDASVMQLYARWLQRHNSDGTALRIYARDKTTPLITQAVTMSPLNVDQGF